METVPSLNQSEKLSELDDSLQNLVGLSGVNSRWSFFPRLALLNIFILLCRPQYSFPPLSWTWITLGLALLPTLKVAEQIHPIWRSGKPAKAMILLLAFGALWTPFARNNFMAFYTFRDLAQQDFCYLFPILIFLGTGVRLNALARCLVFCCVYLAVYALLHGGRGPGGFLGDENDICVQLDALVGIPLFLLSDSKQFSKKIIYAGLLGVIFLGIVGTVSRGGFLGLVAALLYVFWKTPHKVTLTIGAVLIALGTLAFIPKEYFEEVKSISETDSGTAHQRRELWKIGMRMWLNKEHFLFGTGMQNTPYYMRDYEPDENRGPSGTSVGGRAVHSMYVQMVADLGLTGLLIFLTSVIASIRGNHRSLKYLKHSRAQTFHCRSILSRPPEHLGGPSEDPGRLRVLSLIESEIAKLSAFLLGINACIFGALVSGAFVSIFYYPTLWLLVVVGIALRQYAQRLNEGVETLTNVCDPATIRQPRQALASI